VSDSGNTFVTVTVSGTVRDQRGNPVVLLKSEHGEEVLPIWVGHAEGLAIELQLKGETFERPLTYDLFSSILASIGTTVVKVAVTDLRDSTFFARIYLQHGNDVYVIDSRPSDAIALALKTDAEIQVAEHVFSSHKRILEGNEKSSDDGDGELRRYLEDLDPGDF
jgi:bifunctional DNase/RNase